MTVDLEWLKSELEQLSNVRHLADSAQPDHTEGVVYAVQPEPVDFDWLRYHQSMGIEATAPIPPSRIIAKISVPQDYEKGPLPSHLSKDSLRKTTFGAGLISVLRSRGG